MVSPQALSWGVFFTQYTVPIGAICRKHVVSYQLYADDTQIHVTFNVDDNIDRKIALNRIEKCIAEIRAWMSYTGWNWTMTIRIMSTLCRQ